MTCSRDAALDILSKWTKESTSLWVMHASGDAFISFGGTIRILLTDGVKITNANYVEATVNLEEFGTFEYGDVREIAVEVPDEKRERIVSWLSMKTISTNHLLLICEINPNAPEN